MKELEKDGLVFSVFRDFLVGTETVGGTSLKGWH